MKTKRNILLILLPFLINGWLVAQVAQVEPDFVDNERPSDVVRAQAAIQIFPDAVLVVRIPSHSKKIAELQQRIDSGSPNAERYQAMLTESQTERTEFGVMLMSAFTDAYDFSQVYFIWDTTRIEAGTGLLENVFLDEYLKLDSSKSLSTKEAYFVAYMGQTDGETGTGVNALIICEQTMEPLKAPFPYCAPYNFGVDSLRVLLFRNVTEADVLRRSIKKLNRDLHRYHAQITASNQ
ncbi:MAG: hypothetical protein KDC34_05310 [Saprospiraceae bacterium]|nr:hypothetical protein [Saprospiraceae bacterium]